MTGRGHRTSLFGAVVFTAMAIAFAVSCTSKSGGTGFVTGHVHSEGGASIEGATINLDASQASSSATGDFSLDVDSGRRALVASAANYQVLHATVMVAAGDNALDVTLIACTPGAPGCNATPTPTVTPTPLPTPPPDANLFATFSGVNYVNSLQAWTGNAVLNGTLVFGNQSPNGPNYAFSDCYKDANEQFSLSMNDPRSAIDHCVVVWYRANAATQMGYQDAEIDLVVPGAYWNDGFRCSVGLGTCSIEYYEFAPPNTYTQFASATAGIADIVKAGYYNPQQVIIDNGAFTALDIP